MEGLAALRPLFDLSGRTVVVLSLALVAASCASDTTAQGPAPDEVVAEAPEPAPLADDRTAELAGIVGEGVCDPLDDSRCLLPFPSAHFTIPDDDSETGIRVQVPEGQLANTDGSTLDPTEWNRNDGFSPATPILVDLGDVDIDASALPRIGEIGASMEETSGSTLVDLNTGARIPHWSEMDSNIADGGNPLLIIRPAVVLAEGHDVGVGIGPLDTTDASPIEPSLAFEVFRENLTTGIASIERRRVGMEELFGALGGVGVDRGSLVAAWRFTVASAENLSERLLTMRDEANSALGGTAPDFSVDQVVSEGLPDGITRSVRGTFDVPLFLTGGGEPGSGLNYGDDGLPERGGGSYAANFTCQIPGVALRTGNSSARPVVYGHGLLGSASESENSQVAKIASTNNMVYCATDWIGMSASDIGNAAAILGNLSLFPSLPDRSQQGILNSLFLARLMGAGDGFTSHPAFRTEAGAAVIDQTEVYYDGNSQGGIIGGAATAVSQDWTRAVLGVPGMNYSMLLTRSVDFNEYFAIMKLAYPDPVDQQIIYGLLQMLWDRAETSGYAQHITSDPYANTPRHDVLLHVAFGDHQVAPITAEIAARSIGAKLREPALEPGRHPDRRPFYGIEPIESYPFDGSALVYFDSGTLPPPPGNITPASSEQYDSICGVLSEHARNKDDRCADPHENPRRAPSSIQQKDAFFRPDGVVIDPCDGRPCTAEQRHNLDY